MYSTLQNQTNWDALSSSMQNGDGGTDTPKFLKPLLKRQSPLPRPQQAQTKDAPATLPSAIPPAAT